MQVVGFLLGAHSLISHIGRQQVVGAANQPPLAPELVQPIPADDISFAAPSRRTPIEIADFGYAFEFTSKVPKRYERSNELLAFNTGFDVAQVKPNPSDYTRSAGSLMLDPVQHNRLDMPPRPSVTNAYHGHFSSLQPNAVPFF